MSLRSLLLFILKHHLLIWWAWFVFYGPFWLQAIAICSLNLDCRRTWEQFGIEQLYYLGLCIAIIELVIVIVDCGVVFEPVYFRLYFFSILIALEIDDWLFLEMADFWLDFALFLSYLNICVINWVRRIRALALEVISANTFLENRVGLRKKNVAFLAITLRCRFP